MSDLTFKLTSMSHVPEVMATTATIRNHLPPGFAETPLAVTVPQCGFDLNSLLYDNVGGKIEYQGGDFAFEMMQKILFDTRLGPCEKTWIIKHEKKHVQENEKVFRSKFLPALKADASFRTLTTPHVISASVSNFGDKVNNHMNQVAARIFHVFGKLMAEAAKRIDTKSEYEDVDGHKKNYCGAGTSTIPKFSVLRKGSTGSDVVFAQRLLNAGLKVGLLRGEPLEVDGIFGTLTKQRVKEFQKKVFVSVDGVVGPITWALMMVLAPFSG